MKLPSQNIEAEQSLIATLLINNSAYEECSDLIQEDFYKTAHRIIFTSIMNLILDNKAADLLTVTDDLKKKNELARTGGASYLVNLVDNCPIANTKEYVKIIKDCSLTRQIHSACMKIQDSQEAGESLLSIAQSELLKIQPNTNEDKIVNVRDIVLSHIDRIEKANTKKQERGYKTGFPNLDRCMKLHGSKLVIIAGRPGMGKTALAVTMARNMDKMGICVGFLSIEMPESEIMDRWLAIESGVDSSKFGKYKALSPNEYQNISDAAACLYESKIMIDETGSLDITDVERKCRKMKKTGAQVLFIDQLSQIGNRHIKSGENTALYSENCNRIARLKKELKIPIFLLAQLNRGLEIRNNKEPRLSDLKQTGSLEEDADIVIFVYRPEEYATTKKEKESLEGKVVLNIAKNRSGPKYRDKGIRFSHATTHFYQGME